MRFILLIVALVIGCDDDSIMLPPGREFAPPPGVSAHVELLREVDTGIAAIPGCGLLAGGVLYDVDGAVRPAVVPPGDVVGAADLNGDGALDLVTAAADGTLYWHRNVGCSWPDPEQLGGPLAGLGRGVHRDGDELRVGWSDGARVCRTFVRSSGGGGWSEVDVPERPLAIRRTWFVRTWHERALYGLDAGEGFTDPPLAGVAWAAADPMGAAELLVAGRPMLFVSGLPSRSMLLDEVGADHAEEAGVRGPALVVTWQAAAGDFNGDGLDDVVALALAGHNTMDGQPRRPRVLLQLEGGRFATLSVDGPRLATTWLACLGTTCVAAGNGAAVLLRISVE